MSTWVIGDVQGCHATLEALLRRVAFDAKRDRVWLVGDLVNRGPSNVEVLRWARDLGDACVAVLGNHDLRLLAIASGVSTVKDLDTVQDVVDARDGADLIDWLRQRPLMHREAGWTMVHAGLLPQWSVDDAERLAREAEAELRRGPLGKAMKRVPLRPSVQWDDVLGGTERMAAIVAGLVRLRTCDVDGRPDWEYSGPPETAPPGHVPWFDAPGRRSRGERVVFGHWSALGLMVREDACALDTGCVWGRSLSAMRLEDGAVVQQPTIDRLPHRDGSGE